MCLRLIIFIWLLIVPAVATAEDMKFTESELIVNLFRYYGLTMNETGVWNKSYYSLTNKYSWPVLEADSQKPITVGKASKLLMLSQGINISEGEAVNKLMNLGYIPYNLNIDSFLTPTEMIMLKKYIVDNKPLKVIKPVITKSEADQAVINYKNKGYKVRKDLEYYPTGDYLYYGRDIYYYFTKDTTTTKLDENGIPMAVYCTEYYYNPVTLAQYALALYGRILLGENLHDKFFAACDKLISLQDIRGAFRFPFAFNLSREGKTLSPGWVSGMAQGQALSALSRAYRLSNDVKYLKAGNISLYYMTLPNTGIKTTLGDLSPELTDYVFFEEYPTSPNTYTLNGFMFTILGLYDWWQLNPEERAGNHAVAKTLYNESMSTLKYILPYFDAGGYSLYDLSHITYKVKPFVNIGYHKTHLELLVALYSVSNDQWLNYYKNLWLSYVE